MKTLTKEEILAGARMLIRDGFEWVTVNRAELAMQSYSDQENARLTAINEKQAELIDKLKEVLVLDEYDFRALQKYKDKVGKLESELQSLQSGKEKEEEPKHPTSWRDFTMTDVEPKCKECPSKQFYEANTAKIMDKIEEADDTLLGLDGTENWNG